MTNVERRDGVGLQPFGQRDDDRIHQAEIERFVALVDALGRLEIRGTAPLDRKRARGQIREPHLLGFGPELGQHQVIHLGQDRPREDPRVRVFFVRGAQGVMMAIAAIQQREDGAGVGDDHFDLPSPRSNASARSPRFPRPLANAPTDFATRRVSCLAT